MATETVSHLAAYLPTEFVLITEVSITAGFSYCGDYKGLIYISGPKSQPLGDMDIDCDGTDNSAGQCADDPSGQSQTSFRSTAIPYGVPDLNSSVHSYVVFGNEGDKPSFDPMEAGMEPLSVMAVVCNNNLAS